ncbi:FAD/NAD(P)-binding protein [Mycolicibacter hiberniae]|uniref:FAD/NAD(P)-binding protein n=1 Tax=Mycolicibacter hiberniae TaxID=29314 RepID=UPI000A148BFD|nr:FAD/NAD(P)-binding protein [Mycolicibacter hiberniae]MCV7085419.1 FAD-dependent oxidoreductase [Mycolicibacter hiberniae]ORV71217.1 pyridine nucleotide-disulfide oxidoreductase [Mycolicibacter hiberniae]
MTGYSWAVIGAGPAGIAAVGRLLDHGVPAAEIVWIDPDFAAGDLGTKWRAVPGNTHVSLFLDYLNASPAFRFAEAPPFELTEVDPTQTCLLGLVADPLVWITEHLCQRVTPVRAMATELTLRNRRWLVGTEDAEIEAKNVILAVGSVPKKLHHPHLEEIPLQVALDPRKLAQRDLDDATVAVFGSSHSAMVALPNLLDTRVRNIVNFYRSPNTYAVYLDDRILFDDTGLKGNAAAWARENIDGTYPDRLQRCHVNDPAFAEQLRACTHVVYTVGFARRQLPATPQWGELEYDAANGILAPGLFGAGIAFPEYGMDASGSGQYRIGLIKFMQRITTALPLWLQYGT